MISIGSLSRLIQPIKASKGRWGISFFANLRDGFQSIAKTHLGLFLILAIEQKNSSDLFFWISLLVGISLFSYIIQLIGERASEKSDGHIILSLKKHYLHKFLHMDNTAVEKIGTGKMQEIIFSGIDNQFALIQDIIVNIIVDVLSIIYAFVLIINQAPRREYALLLIILFGLNTYCIAKGIKILYRTGKKSKVLYGDLHRQEIKLLMNKFEVLQHHQFDKEMDTVDRITRSIKNLWIQGNIRKGLRELAGEILISGSEVFLYLVCGLSIITGNFTLATLVLLLNLLRIISQYIRQIRNKGRAFVKSFVHVSKLRDTFDTIPTISSNSKNKIPSIKHGEISLNNISFYYDEERKIFTDFNLILPAGSVTALVGPSGGGKSTLVKLIAGYVRPNHGIITVDGHHIHEFYLPSYYRHIGYLTQEPSVFDGTVEENLIYGIHDNEGKINDIIDDVLQKSQCHFVYDLPNGLDTEIGERGIRLSGGQRQRLAIAKIMIKNPQIILLDEPTSALDSISEELVSQAMKELFKNRTVVIIAHRLQTVKHADRILYIENGTIVEQGTHEELILLNKKYAKMVDIQTGF